jgi:hypothetical protein
MEFDGTEYNYIHHRLYTKEDLEYLTFDNYTFDEYLKSLKEYKSDELDELFEKEL